MKIKRLIFGNTRALGGRVEEHAGQTSDIQIWMRLLLLLTFDQSWCIWYIVFDIEYHQTRECVCGGGGGVL